HNTVTASTLSDLEKSKRGGTPESPGVRQYVCQPGLSCSAMPPSSTAPLRDPASSRTAECASSCQGEASWARALGANNESKTMAATPSMARAGTMEFMRRLYSLSVAQTIELPVMAH